MIGKILIAIISVSLFMAMLFYAAVTDSENCKDAGARLEAKSVMIGGRCFVNGYGRIN